LLSGGFTWAGFPSPLAHRLGIRLSLFYVIDIDAFSFSCPGFIWASRLSRRHSFFFLAVSGHCPITARQHAGTNGASFFQHVGTTCPAFLFPIALVAIAVVPHGMVSDGNQREFSIRLLIRGQETRELLDSNPNPTNPVGGTCLCRPERDPLMDRSLVKANIIGRTEGSETRH